MPSRAGRREWAGLAVLVLPTLLISIDVSVLHLAQPGLSADLRPSSTQLLWINDVHSLGLPVAQGLQLTNAWYWDMNDETRAFAQRFFERAKAMPTSPQAAVYSSVTQYLKAVEAAGTDNGKAVRAKLGEMVMNDVYHKNAKLRPDGRVMHDMYLMKVKSPQESKSEWDLLKIVDTIPAEKAFLPLEKSQCPLVKKQ